MGTWGHRQGGPPTCLVKMNSGVTPSHRKGGGDALDWKTPRKRPRKRLDRRSEAVAKAVGGGCCRLQMPLKLTLAVRETVLGNEGRTSPTFRCISGGRVYAEVGGVGRPSQGHIKWQI